MNFQVVRWQCGDLATAAITSNQNRNRSKHLQRQQGARCIHNGHWRCNKYDYQSLICCCFCCFAQITITQIYKYIEANSPIAAAYKIWNTKKQHALKRSCGRAHGGAHEHKNLIAHFSAFVATATSRFPHNFIFILTTTSTAMTATAIATAVVCCWRCCCYCCNAVYCQNTHSHAHMHTRRTTCSKIVRGTARSHSNLNAFKNQDDSSGDVSRAAEMRARKRGSTSAWPWQMKIQYQQQL